MVEHEQVDPDRMAVVGGSYGGYMTNWIIGHNDRFRAAVSLYGIFNLITDFGGSNIPGFETDYLGHYYWENPDQWLAHSPGTYAARMHTPVLILHGEADSNTFIANSKEMFTALRKLGRTVEFWHYPREDHGLDNEAHHRMDAMERTLAWVDRYIHKNLVDTPRSSSHEGWWLSVAALSPYSGAAPPAHGRWLQLVVRITAPPRAHPAPSCWGGRQHALAGGTGRRRFLPQAVSMNSLESPMLIFADAFRFILKHGRRWPFRLGDQRRIRRTDTVTQARVQRGRVSRA